MIVLAFRMSQREFQIMTPPPSPPSFYWEDGFTFAVIDSEDEHPCFTVSPLHPWNDEEIGELPRAPRFHFAEAVTEIIDLTDTKVEILDLSGEDSDCLIVPLGTKLDPVEKRRQQRKEEKRALENMPLLNPFRAVNHKNKRIKKRKTTRPKSRRLFSGQPY